MSRLLSDLLAPGVALMQRLRLAAKITLIGALIAVPLAVLTWMRAGDQAAELQVARDELRGARVVQALVAVAVQTQTHRGQTNLLLSGNEAVKQALPETRKKLAAALAAVEPVLAETPPAWGLASLWKPLNDVLGGYAEGRHGPDRAAVFAEHTRQVQALRTLVQRVAERSGLMLDPVAESFYLMDLAVDRILPWTEAAGLLRGQGAGLLARGEGSPQELAQFAGRIALVEEQSMMARARVEALERAGAKAPTAFATAEDATRAFVEAARAGFTGGKPQGDSAAWFAQGTRTIEAVVALEKEVNDRLVGLLTERAAQLNRQRWTGLGLAALGLLAFLWAGTAFYRSTLIALHQVERVVRASAEGDLTQHARVPGSDEFAGMAQSLSAMSRQLGGLVGAIRDTAAEVSRTGERIADDSRDLSDRTSRQAASVEESAATLEQVAQTVRQNGQNVEQVDRLFQQVQQVVQAGGERMRAVVGTMEQIEGTSRRVGEIITVIDGIAFQTNILALNAAVEAARAGEAGRGFAVVAAEVRTLAQRSASAAAEIRQLIQASGAQVGQGVAQIHGTRDTLAGLGEQVGMVAQALDQLATATREQTDAVAQVSEAVRQIDETTQGNARSVEAAAANAAALREQADHLQGLVGRLRVTESVEAL